MQFGGKCMLDFEQLHILKSKGCNDFEVHMSYDSADFDKADEYAELINDVGMNCYCLHAPYSDKDGRHMHLGELDNQAQKNTIDSLKQTISLAEYLGVPKVCTHLGGYIKNKHNSMELRAQTLEMEQLALEQIKDLLNFIEGNQLNVTLCVENIFCYGDDSTTLAPYVEGLFKKLNDISKIVEDWDDVGMCPKSFYGQYDDIYDSFKTIGKEVIISGFKVLNLNVSEDDYLLKVSTRGDNLSKIMEVISSGDYVYLYSDMESSYPVIVETNYCTGIGYSYEEFGDCDSIDEFILKNISKLMLCLNNDSGESYKNLKSLTLT